MGKRMQAAQLLFDILKKILADAENKIGLLHS
jgi:hypothetical protein